MPENSKINFEDTAIAFAAKSNRQLIKTRLLFSTFKYPWMVKTGTFLTTFALKMKLPVRGIIKNTLFEQFCGGESIRDCSLKIHHLEEFNVKTILDYSVEGQETDESFDRTTREAIRVADFARTTPGIPFVVIKLTGLGPSALMARKQAGETLSEDECARYNRIRERADQIAARANDGGLKFMIDAEESWIQDVIDEIAVELMLRYNRERPVVYNTYQLYRRRAFPSMKSAFEKVTAAGCFFGSKLVRGAYMEKERDRAEELGYEDPIQPDKASTDRDYNRALGFALEHIDRFSLCAGTHNEHSSQLLASLMDAHGVARDDERIYFAQLLGMSDNISFKLADLGYNVAKYVPYGPVEKVLPYLFRRAEENTSIAGQSSRESTLVKKELKRRKTKVLV